MERLGTLSTPSVPGTLVSLPWGNWVTLNPHRASLGLFSFNSWANLFGSLSWSGSFKLYLLWFSVCVDRAYLSFVFFYVLFRDEPLWHFVWWEILLAHCKPLWEWKWNLWATPCLNERQSWLKHNKMSSWDAILSWVSAGMVQEERS